MPHIGIDTVQIDFNKHDELDIEDLTFEFTKRNSTGDASTSTRATVNCCVLRNFLSGGFLDDSVFEGPSFDDECDLLIAA